MAELGDSIKDKQLSSLSAVGVKKILKSDSSKAVKGYSMTVLSLEAMEIPGRVSTDKNLELSLIDSMKAALQEKDLKLGELRKQTEKQQKSAFETGLAQGRQEGIQQGKTEASEKYHKSLQALEKQLEEMLQSFASQKGSLFQEFEKRIPQIVMKSINKIFSGMADRHTEAIVPIIRKAVRSIGAAETIVVKVNPENLQAVEENQNLWHPFENGCREIRLEKDPQVPTMSCLVEGNSATAEVNIQKILANMEAELADVFNQAGETSTSPDLTNQDNRLSPAQVKKEGE